MYGNYRIMPLSNTEENYLKAIYKIAERENKSANTNTIAKYIGTAPASVTDMLKRLASKQLINYQKYRGVTLTTHGGREATQLIRRHRLWETFLVSKLRFSWESVHDIAEDLEHIKSDELVNRLDAFLDYPKFDPHGDPIPNAQGKFTIRNQMPISDLLPGNKAMLLGVREHETSFLQYLNELNISLGTEFTIKSFNHFDKSMNVLIDHTRETLVSDKVCQILLVKKI